MRSQACILAAVAAFSLSACGSPEEKAKQAAERPAADALTAEQVAARATTPQASMTPAERQRLHDNMTSLLDQSGAERAEGHVQVPGVPDQVVAMQPLQSHNFTVPMVAGKPYLVFGTCDGDCTVVDLALLGPGGDLIKSDTDSADFPVLDYTPTAAGTYTVRITMAKCAVAPCYAGARVYQKS
jgi:hypothetical protein